MSKKNKSDKIGFVFSTDPDFKFDFEEEQVKTTLLPAQQKLRISLDKKQRAGKTVSLIEGFIGSAEDLEELCRRIKNHCGTGGSAKDGYIVIQGDQKEKIKQWLIKNSYLLTRVI